MNWAQENKSLAGIVGVMVAGGLGLGVWLYLSWSSYSTSMEDWNQVQTQIKTIKGKKLAPTQANVDLRQKQLEEYASGVNDLRGAVLDVQQPVKPMSETEFQAKLKERSAAVKELAKTARMKALPDDFALGFDKYATQPPRNAEVAAELNTQLDAIDKLVSTVIDAGVNSIDLLDRAKLPNEEGNAPVAPTGAAAKSKGAAKAPAKGAKGAKKTLITVESAAEPVLDRYTIKLLFTTDQGPFQTIVNTLCHPSKMPYFMVVRQIRVENTRLDGPTKEEMNQRKNSAATAASSATPATAPDTSGRPPPAPGSAEAKAAAAAAAMIPKAAPGVVDAFDIMGRELLKVYMEIDYIRFRPAAKVEEEEAPAPAAATAAPAPAKP